MSKKLNLIIFLTCLIVSLVLVTMIHIVVWEHLVSNESDLFVAETTLYLTGLGTLFFGWRLIDHKLPSKRSKDEH